MLRVPGRHFLQIPGPTNTPLRILAAIAQPTIDHRGPEFQKLARSVLARIRGVFGTGGADVQEAQAALRQWLRTLRPLRATR